MALAAKIKPGQTVAVTAGSRGIANIQHIIKAAVEHLKRLGARPFIVPSMGSHGGGTAEGQREVIEGYGITEEYLGCPIRSSMETVIVCQAAEGFPVHFDKHAFGADHVVADCGTVVGEELVVEAAASHRARRWHVVGGQGAARGQLNQKRLHGGTARLNLHAVVHKQLERVGGDGHVAEPQDVQLH